MPLYEAEVEHLRVVRQGIGPVYRRIQFGTGEFGTLVAEVESAFFNADICFTGAANNRTVPLDLPAAGTWQGFLPGTRSQQSFYQYWIVFD